MSITSRLYIKSSHQLPTTLGLTILNRAEGASSTQLIVVNPQKYTYINPPLCVTLLALLSSHTRHQPSIQELMDLPILQCSIS